MINMSEASTPDIHDLGDAPLDATGNKQVSLIVALMKSFSSSLTREGLEYSRGQILKIQLVHQVAEIRSLITQMLIISALQTLTNYSFVDSIPQPPKKKKKKDSRLQWQQEQHV